MLAHQVTLVTLLVIAGYPLQLGGREHGDDQGEIFGSEDVSPLARAMGLVDHEEVDRRLLQDLAKGGGRQPLGGRIHELDLAGGDVRESRLFLGRLEDSLDSFTNPSPALDKSPAETRRISSTDPMIRAIAPTWSREGASILPL